MSISDTMSTRDTMSPCNTTRRSIADLQYIGRMATSRSNNATALLWFSSLLFLFALWIKGADASQMHRGSLFDLFGLLILYSCITGACGIHVLVADGQWPRQHRVAYLCLFTPLIGIFVWLHSSMLAGGEPTLPQLFFRSGCAVIATIVLGYLLMFRCRF